MKRVALLVVTLLFVFTLSACGNVERTLSCEFDFMGTSMDMEYVYTKKEIISVSMLGETITDEEYPAEITELEDELVEEFGERDFYALFDEMYDESLEDETLTCTID